MPPATEHTAVSSATHPLPHITLTGGGIVAASVAMAAWGASLTPTMAAMSSIADMDGVVAASDITTHAELSARRIDAHS